MLLPSSASNPANMMAQALTMYKSLLGNVSSDKQGGNMPLSVSAKLEGNDTSGEEEVKGKTSTTANVTNESQDYHGKSGFSLQTPPKRE